MTTKEERKVLIVCTHNAVRSQIAEAVVNRHVEGWTAVSAGSDPRSPHPLALSMLEKEGYDVGGMRSKRVGEVLDDSVDLLLFVCGEADSCVHISAAVPRRRMPLPDPVAEGGDDDARAEGLRELHRRLLSELPALLR